MWIANEEKLYWMGSTKRKIVGGAQTEDSFLEGEKISVCSHEELHQVNELITVTFVGAGSCLAACY